MSEESGQKYPQFTLYVVKGAGLRCEVSLSTARDHAMQCSLVTNAFNTMFPQFDRTHGFGSEDDPVGVQTFSTYFYTGDEARKFWTLLKDALPFTNKKAVDFEIEQVISEYLNQDKIKK
jgi:Ni,Fe-hydrogenase III component G